MQPLVRPLTPFTEGGPSISASGGPIVGSADEKAKGMDDEEESTENARRRRVAKRPQLSTEAEYDAHMSLHADYRDLCPDCVAGRGISHQHRASNIEMTGRIFSLGYAFMTAEDVGEDMCPVLVGYDNDSHGVWALAVDAKGATKPSVQWVKGKIDDSGCSGTPVSIRSDQEEAIMALKKAVAIYRQAETVMLESPARDSKANGAAERAVMSWACLLRTIKHHVERRLKTSIPKDSAMMTWLVSWAADIISRYKVHITEARSTPSGVLVSLSE